MEPYDPRRDFDEPSLPPGTGEPVLAEAVGEPPPERPKVLLPLGLFLATCVTTYLAGGPAFAAALMFTLTCHEFGHFFQAVRYRVPASLPFFIPIPAKPLGTMGAVIAMHPGMGNRKALFDIGITGPIAGLIPALIFCAVGLQLSTVQEIVAAPPGSQQLGSPLLFQFLVYLIHGPIAEGHTVSLHAIAFAGWVGIFITALNMIPIGQLDGGHVLYALLRKKAHPVATALLLTAIAAVVLWGYWMWVLMLLLLVFIGPEHPPTANDNMPLGPGRTILGWISLGFVLIGFTPTPFM